MAPNFTIESERLAGLTGSSIMRQLQGGERVVRRQHNRERVRQDRRETSIALVFDVNHSDQRTSV